MKLNLGPILKRKGITQVTLANRIGVSASFISEIISHKKQPSMETLSLIVEALGVSPGEIYDDSLQKFGLPPPAAADSHLSDSTATPFEPRPKSNAEAILDMTRRNAGHAQMFTANRDCRDLGLLAGDKVVVDLKGKIRPGDVVICTIISSHGEAHSHFRRWLDPWLVSGSDIDRADATNASAAILGRVIGVARGEFL